MLSIVTWLEKIQINYIYEKIIKEEKNMGFDINGLNPNKEPTHTQYDKEEPVGKYFRNNVWWWRKMWGMVGSIGEYVYRDQQGIPQDTRDSEMNQHNREELVEWRKMWQNGTYNDGQKYEGKWLTLVEDTLQYAIDNKDSKDITDFLKFLDKEIGSDYQFNWKNVEEFHEFVVNSGGFEIW